MAYTLQQIFEALGKVENGGAMVADLQDVISKTRTEAANNRVARNKVLDMLGLRDGDNLDTSLQNLATTMAIVKQLGNPEELGTKMTALEKQLKDLTEKYTASEQKATEEHDKRIQTAIKSQLTAALAKGKAIQPDVFTQLLLANVKAKEDDSLVFKSGDKEISIAEGVEGWLKANPWAIKNDSHSGAGSGSGGNSGNDKKYSMEDIKGMSRDEINAHWDEISKGVKV